MLAHVRAHGAAVVRTSLDAEGFSKFCTGLHLKEFDGSQSAAPRTYVAPHVWTANEAPAHAPIPFHHEMAQCREYPKYVLFYCQTPPRAGGCTPVVRSADVATAVRAAQPRGASLLDARGIRYCRVLPEVSDANSPIGRSWRDTYGTTRRDAENSLAAQDMAWEWLPNGDLRTMTPRRPVFRHMGDHEVFFNSAVAARQGWRDARNDASTAVLFGDGAPLTPEAAHAFDYAGGYMHAAAHRHPWRAGDVLVIDNERVLHARDTFTPPRRVLASLWGGPS